eukprot:gnl/TRDRNA2_/TRDRNA2_163044_c0_seq1.p1 gnl/TRDRNA2_/TRDRNA2_163044_c0~~gnl/TRDRNA2_/TRDRNA2_163044_c0_seq1.p1  ORF type:complete len:720 (+),score=166.21 gnl/TRDRNA2_/TRDRNA2_163044_c0_seq1:52-2211(+)
MFACTSISVAGKKHKGKQPTAADHLIDVTAATVRVAARVTDPVLPQCCRVEKAEVEVVKGMDISRPPGPAERFADKPSMPGAPVSDADRKKAIKGAKNQAKEEPTAKVCVLIQNATGLPKADFMGTADPYVEVRCVFGDPLKPSDFPSKAIKKQKSKALDAKTVFMARTEAQRGTLTPTWNQRFTFEVPIGETEGEMHLYFRVFDYDLVGDDDFLGHCSVTLVDALMSSKELSGGFRGLLRCCPAAADKLETLSDGRLMSRPPVSYKLQPVTGQETTFDLSAAEIFIDVDLPDKIALRPNSSNYDGDRSDRPLSSEEIEGLEKDFLRALVGGVVPLARRALSRGAPVNACMGAGEFKGCSALHIACLKGMADFAMALVDVYDASLVQPAPGGRSSAMCACEAGEEALAEWLVQEGVPVDLRDSVGRTVLFYSAKAALPQLTAWLVGKQRQAPNSRAMNGSTPLFSAVAGGLPASAAVAQQLLEAKANANIIDADGQSPLHAACQVGDTNCVKLLLDRGKARADLVDKEGRMPLDLVKPSALPKPMMERLENLTGDEAAGGQKRGETASAYEKREARARKNEISSQSDWRTWRVNRPRAFPNDSGAGIGDFSGEASSPEIVWNAGDTRNDSALDDLTPRSWASLNALGKDKVPLFVGQAKAGGGADVAKTDAEKTGRLSRLKTWATSLRKNSQPKKPDASVFMTDDISIYGMETPRTPRV